MGERSGNEPSVTEWIVALTGLTGVVASPVVGLDNRVGGTALALGIVLAGFLTPYLRRRRHKLFNAPAIECLSCTVSFELSGRRGRTCKVVETMKLRFNSDVLSFQYGLKSSDGGIANEQFSVSFGDDGNSIRLKKDQVFLVTEENRKQITLILPAPVKAGAIITVKNERTSEGAFESDNEWVAKNVLYPTKELVLSLTCTEKMSDAMWQVKQGFVPGKAELMNLATVDGKVKLEHRWENAEPGDHYRISWRWD